MKYSQQSWQKGHKAESSIIPQFYVPLSIQKFKCLFGSILLFLATLATAQEYQYIPFPGYNTVWSEIHYKSISEPGRSWVYYKDAFLNNDTVINGLSYHILFHTQTNTILKDTPVLLGFMREDSLRKIWIKYNIQGVLPNTNEYGEYLLYDFSLKQGDTIHGSLDYFVCLSDYIVLDSVGYVKIQNKVRKVYFFNIPWEIWIEGIGKIKGLTYRSGAITTDGNNNDLICMHQNDSLEYYYPGKYNQYDDCLPSFVIDGIGLLPNTEVKIYPNPATNGKVYFENLDFETLELYDLNGSIIRKESLKGKDCYELNVSGLPLGIYAYRLKTNGLVPTMGKIIVQ